MDLINLSDLTSIALLTFATVGAVQLVKALFRHDYEQAAIITVSALLPAVLAGFTSDISSLQGAIIGLNASGLIYTASRIGTN